MRFFMIVQVILALLVAQVVILGVIFVLKKQMRKLKAPVPSIDYGHLRGESSGFVEVDAPMSIESDIYFVPKWYEEQVVQEYNQKHQLMQLLEPPSTLPSWAAMPFAKLGSLLSHHTTASESAPAPAPAPASSPVPVTTREMIHRLDFTSNSERFVAARKKAYGLPFVLSNLTGMSHAVQRWTSAFLAHNLGSRRPLMVERSTTPLFTYYTLAGKVDELGLQLLSWTPPQIEVPMTYMQFAQLVNASTRYNSVSAPDTAINNTAASASSEHSATDTRIYTGPYHYLTLPAHIGARSPWVMASFPFFDESLPLSPNDPLLLIRPLSNTEAVNSDAISSGHSGGGRGGQKLFKGVNCRLAQQGVTAAAHFDAHDNWVALVRGIRRYVLLPPSECDRLRLLPRQHPSARHSKLDWANNTAVLQDDEFAGARAIEFLLLPGEVLYIPAYWIHYITSVTPSVQCNARFKIPPSAGISDKDVKVDSETMRLLVDHLGSVKNIQQCFNRNR